MKRTIHFLSLLALFFCVNSVLQAQTLLVATAKNETVAVQQRAEAAIPTTDWTLKVRNMDAQTLENLEKWHQFPLGKMMKQNANVSREALTTALQAWYNEKPTDRAKIILSFQ